VVRLPLLVLRFPLLGVGRITEVLEIVAAGIFAVKIALQLALGIATIASCARK
jgi:hypothetical protein